ncbi:MAG: phospholipase [Bacteroidaceae bacterium]|nr:phospholipase [Bacteroidaceae bacterium]
MNNTIILATIFILIIAGFLVINRIYRNRPAAEDHHSHDGEDGVCCGKHTNCAKGYDNSNLYFDDEELDRFKGTKQEEYTEADIEEFRQILYTMKSEEVSTWAHCLQTRGIEMPQEIKDEVLQILQ